MLRQTFPGTDAGSVGPAPHMMIAPKQVLRTPVLAVEFQGPCAGAMAEGGPSPDDDGMQRDDADAAGWPLADAANPHVRGGSLSRYASLRHTGIG